MINHLPYELSLIQLFKFDQLTHKTTIWKKCTFGPDYALKCIRKRSEFHCA